jgi:D-sedoheptulose 7-phosphate isomerase
MDLKQFIISELSASARTLELVSQQGTPVIEAVAHLMVDQLRTGHKVLVFGNGGSAADAQHLSSELIGRYRRERAPIPAIALTTDTSTLTSLSNDYGFENAFSRQVEALARSGDIVIGISTSGSSPNFIQALHAAGKIGAYRIALTGQDAQQLSAITDFVISVPAEETARIQEAHGVIIHILCDIVEEAFSKPLQNGLDTR